MSKVFHDVFEHFVETHFFGGLSMTTGSTTPHHGTGVVSLNSVAGQSPFASKAEPGVMSHSNPRHGRCATTMTRGECPTTKGTSGETHRTVDACLVRRRSSEGRSVQGTQSLMILEADGACPSTRPHPFFVTQARVGLAEGIFLSTCE